MGYNLKINGTSNKTALCLACGDGYIFASCVDNYLRAYTFNGSTFTEVGSYSQSGIGNGFFYKSPYLYISGNCWVRILTFNGSNFTLVYYSGNLALGNGTACIYVDNSNYIHLSIVNGGLYAYYWDGESTFSLLASKTDYYYAGITGDGTYIYTQGFTGASTIVVKKYSFNGISYSTIGTYTPSAEANQPYGPVLHDGTYLYTGTKTKLIAINPSTMNEITTVTGLNTVGVMFHINGYFYCSNGTSIFYCYTFNGSTFTLKGILNPINSYSYPQTSATDGTYIYVASYGSSNFCAIKMTLASQFTADKLTGIAPLTINFNVVT